MNKQRRVLITTTYNEMGIIIDTKAEELSNDSPKVDSDSGDLISRCELFNRLATVQTLADAYAVIQGMQTVKPKLDKKKISDLLWNEYRTMCSHLSAEGMVARRYYCKELWRELFGEEATPVWMTW